ncbi:hypothetical protein B0H13DRAFT_1918415 [Mycena leptocephala]|nr:hypothetical protein B0H13DRAFT_1918415 [Mycena leptocephala]
MAVFVTQSVLTLKLHASHSYAILPAGTDTFPSWLLAMASATPTNIAYHFQLGCSLSLGRIVKSVNSIILRSSRAFAYHFNFGKRGTISAGGIFGIVGAISAVVVLTALFTWYRKRRRVAMRKFTTTPFPIHSSGNNAVDNSDMRSIGTVRQQYLQKRLRAAQEQISDIHHLEQNALAGSTTHIAAEASSSQRAGNGEPDSPDPDLAPQPSDSTAGIPESEVRMPAGVTPEATDLPLASSSQYPPNAEPGPSDPGLVSQVRDLTARIRELEALMQSPWAQGLSDEPPPGYSEEI